GGHEPMFSHDRRYVLTFNGEIYNYRELRDQLRSLGHVFETDSDAEVLLAAISEWGWDAVTHHVGIKPLYYTLIPARDDAPATFLFGSEIKAILASALIKPKLNPEALHQFLT